MKQVDKSCCDKICRDVGNVLTEPYLAQRYATFGCEPFPATKEPFNTFMTAESACIANVIGTSKISID